MKRFVGIILMLLLLPALAMAQEAAVMSGGTELIDWTALVVAVIGVIGTALGVVLGVVFSLNIDSIMSFVNWLNGGGAWDPSIRGIYALPAKLQPWDVAKAVMLALGLSFVVTIFPARRAARLNPVEALRYE